MPLPAGFKVNGSSVSKVSQMPVPPRVQKIIALLDKLPLNELLTTLEVCERLALGISGSFVNHPALLSYREKLDGKLFWGSRKSIGNLRKQLEPVEGTHGKS